MAIRRHMYIITNTCIYQYFKYFATVFQQRKIRIHSGLTLLYANLLHGLLDKATFWNCAFLPLSVCPIRACKSRKKGRRNFKIFSQNVTDAPVLGTGRWKVKVMYGPVEVFYRRWFGSHSYWQHLPRTCHKIWGSGSVRSNHQTV